MIKTSPRVKTDGRSSQSTSFIFELMLKRLLTAVTPNQGTVLKSSLTANGGRGRIDQDVPANGDASKGDASSHQLFLFCCMNIES